MNGVLDYEDFQDGRSPTNCHLTQVQISVLRVCLLPIAIRMSGVKVKGRKPFAFLGRFQKDGSCEVRSIDVIARERVEKAKQVEKTRRRVGRKQ